MTPGTSTSSALPVPTPTNVIVPPQVSGVTYSPNLLVILSVIGAALTQLVGFGFITNTADQLIVAIAGPVVALGVLAYDVLVRHVKVKHAAAIAQHLTVPLVGEIGTAVGDVDPTLKPAIEAVEQRVQALEGFQAQLSAATRPAAGGVVGAGPV